MRKEKMTDIPAKDVDQVVEDYKSEGCTEVTKKMQNNGLWTVEAKCPDKKKK